MLKEKPETRGRNGTLLIIFSLPPKTLLFDLEKNSGSPSAPRRQVRSSLYSIAFPTESVCCDVSEALDAKREAMRRGFATEAKHSRLRVSPLLLGASLALPPLARSLVFFRPPLTHVFFSSLPQPTNQPPLLLSRPAAPPSRPSPSPRASPRAPSSASPRPEAAPRAVAPLPPPVLLLLLLPLLLPRTSPSSSSAPRPRPCRPTLKP